jgi:hypothetical protein
MYFQQWKDYFLTNQSHFSHVDFKKPDLFCLDEQKQFNSSIQQFQRGEHSEGKHLLSYAKQYGDPCYTEAIKLFIKEEQTHALVLAKFLEKHDIPKIKEHWVDGVFRMLRQLSGIENTVTILLVAEIISKVYYKALMKAVSSELLQQICEQILKDEEKHLHFQCCTLKLLLLNKSKTGMKLWELYFKTILKGTTVVVWKYHKNVLKAGGLTFYHFYNSSQYIINELLQMIKGQKEIPSALAPLQFEKLIA